MRKKLKQDTDFREKSGLLPHLTSTETEAQKLRGLKAIGWLEAVCSLPLPQARENIFPGTLLHPRRHPKDLVSLCSLQPPACSLENKQSGCVIVDWVQKERTPFRVRGQSPESVFHVLCYPGCVLGRSHCILPGREAK